MRANAGTWMSVPTVPDLENAPELAILNVLWTACELADRAISARVGLDTLPPGDLLPEEHAAALVCYLSRVLCRAVEEYHPIAQRIAHRMRVRGSERNHAGAETP
jgi:hypothetical protein